MIQKSALRTTLLLAFLSTAPMAVAAPPNDDSTEQIACKLLEANMNAADDLDKALKAQEENYRQHNPNPRNNPESVMGLQKVVQKYWPDIFTLYQQVFGKLDTSNPDNLYATFLANSLNTKLVALDEKVTIADLRNGLHLTEQYPNNAQDSTLLYNCSTDFLKQMLAVANDLRAKNGEPFQQEINEILAEYSREGTTNCLAGLSARLFQPIVGGIQAYLRAVCLYYCKVLDAEGAKSDAKTHWPNLQADYEKIFGAFNPQAKCSPFLNWVTLDRANIIKTMQQAGQQDESNLLQEMVRVSKDLDSKYPDSYTEATNDAAYKNNDCTQIKEAPERLSMTLFNLALGCMKHQLSKTFGNNPRTLLEKIAPKEDPKPISMPPTPASLQQNARSTTPPTTKPRTILPTPDRQTPSASSQSPVNPQPFHSAPATVQPLYAQASPNNTPQASSMRTQMPTTTLPPFMPQTTAYSTYMPHRSLTAPRLDNVDGVSVTTPQISPFSHPPVSTPQTHTPTAPQQNARPTTPQTVPLPHAPPTTKPRTILPTPDRQTPSASSQSPVNPQPFHSAPATVQPLYAQASPNNTPQASSMRTQMPTTTLPPFMPQTTAYSTYMPHRSLTAPRLDNVDGASVTTSQISPFSHPPVPTPQTHTPTAPQQNAPPGTPQTFHRTPATVQPLYTTQASPNNTPQTSSMRTQMLTTTPPPFMPQTPTYSPYAPDTPPAVPRLDNVDGISFTTPQISPFSHPPVSTSQAYTPASPWQNAPSGTPPIGPFPHQPVSTSQAYTPASSWQHTLPADSSTHSLIAQKVADRKKIVGNSSIK